MTDFSFANHGSIALLTPHNEEAKRWLHTHVDMSEVQWWGQGLVIEPRYAEPILEHIQAEGLTIGEA